MNNTNNYEALHAHDYSLIDYNNETFIEIVIATDDPTEIQKIRDRVELIASLLNQNQMDRE